MPGRRPRRHIRGVYGLSADYLSPFPANVRGVFKFLLKLEDGEPNDPAVYVSAVPNYAEGETFLLGEGHRLRILRIDTDIDDGLDITASSDAAYSGDGCGL